VAEERQKIETGSSGENDSENILQQRIAGENDEKSERIKRHGSESCDKESGERSSIKETDQFIHCIAVVDILNRFQISDVLEDRIVENLCKRGAGYGHKCHAQRGIKFAEVEKNRLMRNYSDQEL
jgi:hypothetical protein